MSRPVRPCPTTSCVSIRPDSQVWCIREISLMPDQAERMRQIAERYRRPLRPHVITVTSGKGGAGKSTVALNLAIAFCDLGKRVILLDADANLGGLDVMLKLSPHYRLADVLRDDVDLEDALMTPRE